MQRIRYGALGHRRRRLPLGGGRHEPGVFLPVRFSAVDSLQGAAMRLGAMPARHVLQHAVLPSACVCSTHHRAWIEWTCPAPLTGRTLALDPSAMNLADLVANRWPDASGLGNDLTLANTVWNTNDASLTFNGVDSYAYRATLAAGTLGASNGAQWTGAFWAVVGVCLRQSAERGQPTSSAPVFSGCRLPVVPRQCACDRLEDPPHAQSQSDQLHE